MSVTEDESQGLDEGWDDEPSSASSRDEEDDVDEAWDSLPPPISGAPLSASSMPPVTEAVDSGWDDVPDGAPLPPGKRRPHRQRRAKSNAVVAASSPVMLPRPAEPNKKQNRDHARKQRAYEAQVKEQRKLERKAERSAEMRKEAEARQQLAQAEERGRQERRAEREQAERERRKTQPRAARKPKPASPAPSNAVADQAAPVTAPAKAVERTKPPSRSGLRPGVIVTLVLIAAVALLLILRK